MAKLEKLLHDREEIQRKIAEERSKENRLREKKRRHNFMQIGGLIEIAALDQIDHGALLGGLMTLTEQFKNTEQLQEWKQIGDRIIEDREAKRKLARKANKERSEIP